MLVNKTSIKHQNVAGYSNQELGAPCTRAETNSLKLRLDSLYLVTTLSLQSFITMVTIILTGTTGGMRSTVGTLVVLLLL